MNLVTTTETRAKEVRKSLSIKWLHMAKEGSLVSRRKSFSIPYKMIMLLLKKYLMI